MFQFLLLSLLLFHYKHKLAVLSKQDSFCLPGRLFMCACLFFFCVSGGHACTHARAKTHTYAHTHTHTHKCMHTRTHSYVHTCTHMHTHTCTRNKFVTIDSAEPPFFICFMLYYETHVSSWHLTGAEPPFYFIFYFYHAALVSSWHLTAPSRLLSMSTSLKAIPPPPLPPSPNLSLSVCLSPCLSLSNSLSRSLSFSLTHLLTHTHTLTHSLTHTHTHSHTHTHTLTYSLTHSLTHLLSITISRALSVSLSLSGGKPKWTLAQGVGPKTLEIDHSRSNRLLFIKKMFIKKKQPVSSCDASQ